MIKQSLLPLQGASFPRSPFGYNLPAIPSLQAPWAGGREISNPLESQFPEHGCVIDNNSNSPHETGIGSELKMCIEIFWEGYGLSYLKSLLIIFLLFKFEMQNSS